MPTPELSRKIEKGRFLPKLDERKYENLAPIQAFLDGFIDLKVLELSEAKAIFHEFGRVHSDPLEGRRIKRETVKGLLKETDGISKELFGKELKHEYIDPNLRDDYVDEHVRKVVSEKSSTRSRVMFIDHEDAYLVIGFSSDKTRPLLIDPHHPRRVEERKKRWFLEALQRGYWVLSKPPVEIFPDPEFHI